MKRVQLILEEWQHEWLAEEGERSGQSMSSLLRALLTEAIERRQMGAIQDDPLWGAVGMGAGPLDGVDSTNLDGYLYGLNPRSAMRQVAETGPEGGDGLTDEAHHR